MNKHKVKHHRNSDTKTDNRDHIRTTALERSVMNYWGGLNKARFIAYTSSCTTAVLSKLLTSSLNAVKSCAIRYYETVYERSMKDMFWSIKILARNLVNYNQEVSVQLVCRFKIFLLLIPQYPIV